MQLLSEQPIFTIRAELAGILKLGPTPYGERRVINILGGSVTGPRLQGRIHSASKTRVNALEGAPRNDR